MSQSNTDNVAGALKKDALGPTGIVFLVVSATAPLSILAGIAPLAVLIGGISAPLVYLFAGVVLAIFAIGYLYMARNVKALGGFYTYVTATLGKAVGLGSGLVAWFSYNVLQIGLYGLLGVMGNGLLNQVFQIDIPWYVVAIVLALAVYGLAVTGVDVGAKVLGVMLVAETLVLVILAVAILAAGGDSGFGSGTFDLANIANPGMIAIMGFGFAAFMGFESTTLYRDETRDPNRSIPRATYIAVAFLAIFYSAILWVVIQGFGEANAQGAAGDDPTGFFFTAMGRYVGDWGVTLMFVLIVTSLYAGQLAFHNAINRYSYALARDGILPNVFHRTNAKAGQPWIAGLIQTIVSIVVVVFFAAMNLDPILNLVIWVNSPGVYGIVALQALTSIAVVVYIVKHKDASRRWYVLPAAIVASVSMIALFILLNMTVDVLTAAGPVVNGIILSIVPIILVVGIVYAMVLKSSKPVVYARIGGE
jgi:amino acid transporter